MNINDAINESINTGSMVAVRAMDYGWALSAVNGVAQWFVYRETSAGLEISGVSDTKPFRLMVQL